MERIEFEIQIDELLDKALNELTPSEYIKLLDNISSMLNEKRN